MPNVPFEKSNTVPGFLSLLFVGTLYFLKDSLPSSLPFNWIVMSVTGVFIIFLLFSLLFKIFRSNKTTGVITAVLMALLTYFFINQYS